MNAAEWLTRIRASRGFDLTVRGLGSGWFLLLAIAQARKGFAHAQGMGIADFGPNGWPALLSTICILLFYLALGCLMLLRPSPVARTSGVLPSLIAFIGSYLPWTIVVLAPGGASTSQNLASALLLLIGTGGMIIIVLHLGRCFSIVPQARGLVRTGPYAFVRDPLYLAEEIALLGTLLHYLSLLTLAMFLAHGAIQIRRIFYEETLLRLSFPLDYDGYAASTPRLIPFIW